MQNVDEFVETLTSEERTRLHPLIEECRLRELNIKLASTRAKHYLGARSEQRFAESLQSLRGKSRDTLEHVTDLTLKTELLALHLKRRREDGA